MNRNELLKKLRKKKIAVLYGGFSSERTISIKSGKAVLNAAKKLKLSVCGIDVDKNIVEKLKREKINLAYIALHGPLGEDGTIQGLLEIMKIPYTGCGVFASSASMDKDISKKLFKINGILTPEWKTLKNFDNIPKMKNYPLVVKPMSQGSAVGVSIVENFKQLVSAAKNAFKYDNEILIEQFIEGKEITVGVLNGKSLPIVEIVPKAKFYDFKSKYSKGGSQHIIPARISKNVEILARHYAEKIYKNFKCKTLCRVDMIVDKKENLWTLENNTCPGMTETSLFPDEAKAAGINFEELVLTILEGAL
jgi:D-alanine-D-alanine ligase